MPVLLNSLQSGARQVIEIREVGKWRVCALPELLITVMQKCCPSIASSHLSREDGSPCFICSLLVWRVTFEKNKRDETKQKRIWYLAQKRVASVLDIQTTAFRFTCLLTLVQITIQLIGCQLSLV